MVSFWGKRVVVFFALLCVFCFGMSSPANAQGESYRWFTYDSIVGGGGSFKALDPLSDEPVAHFKQDPDNPNVFKASELPSCEGTIVLTLGSFATKGSVTMDGDCPEFKDYDARPVIQRLGDAVESVRREEQVLQKLHTDKSCSGKDMDGDVCRASAKNTQTQHVQQCQAAHAYDKNPALGNAYLDCLAKALDVERPTTGDDEEKPAATANACNLPDPGWALCQMIQFTAWLADNTFGLLEPFIEIEPLTKDIGVRAGETSVYVAWQSLRDVANVTLVLAFFFVIYSHLTSLGLRTYDIKKAFPRMVVTAMLINVSFFAAGAVVDLSNIFGRSIQSVAGEFGKTIHSESSVYSDWSSASARILSLTPTDKEFTEENATNLTNKEREALGLGPKEPDPAQTGSAATTGTLNNATPAEDDPIPTKMVVNGITITGSMVLFANLAVLVPLMVVALFSMFVTLMVLLLRQAVVIILVVLSPLAAAAFIFPSTKQYFDKWRSTFVQILMLYPIIALIYASSKIASGVIQESALNNGQTMLAMFSMAIMVVPLLVTPLVLKFGGGLVGQFGGILQGKLSGAKSSVVKSASGFRKYRKDLKQTRRANNNTALERIKIPYKPGKAIQPFKAIGAVNTAFSLPSAVRMGRERRAANAERAAEEFTARNMHKYTAGIKDPELRNDLNTALLANIGDVDLKNVEAEAAVLSTTPPEDLKNRAVTGRDENGNELSERDRRAAQMAFMSKAKLADVHDLIENSNSMDAKQRADLVNQIRKHGFTAQAPHLSAGALNAIIEGKDGANDVNQLVANAAEAGRFSGGARLTGSDEDTLQRLHMAMQANQVSAIRMREIVSQAQSEAASGRSRPVAGSALDKISRMPT
jgi:hypothetical protein